ncbi:N-acetylneuraminate synthase family protein [Candidatus Peregrinibacteria bacterium]|nr:N-acetylneuraminate synthase family protein [Candidatus Peregrinibacteria bacterium]
MTVLNFQHLEEQNNVFVIAEIGINHSGNMEKARALIREAANVKADGVKLQTYITEKRVPKDSPIFDILKKCELSFEQQAILFKEAKEQSVVLFSTPFDEESVDFLEEMDVPCFKIASFDIVNQKLLQYIAAKGRPVLCSRGMANREEIDRALATFRTQKTPHALLHCISAYPVASLSDLHLRTIPVLKERYHCPIGYSDHSKGIEAAPIAVAAGAVIIEKHFMLESDADAPDAPVSLIPQKFQEMVLSIRHISEMLGNSVWGATEAEKGTLQFRRVQSL